MKVLLADAVQHTYHVYQFNVETAFLYGNIDAVVHVSQVAGFEVPGKEDWVWKLNKSLYGTKQAPWCWRAYLSSTLIQLGLTPSVGDESIFLNTAKTLKLHIHMDDCLIVGKDWTEIERFLTLLGGHYKIKVQECPTQHLGYTLQWNKDGSIKLHQQDFTKKELVEFGFENVNVVKAPAPMNIHNIVSQESPEFEVKTMQKALGHLIHLATHT